MFEHRTIHICLGFLFAYGFLGSCVPIPPPDMAQIPAGCFDMGDHFGDSWDDQLPVHNVCISAFEMDFHEVTNAEYAKCVEDGACSAPSDSSSYTRASYYDNPTYNTYPVINIIWVDAHNYCSWAGKRLPTEAEWEYAARGGLEGKRFPWGGDSANRDDDISGTDANYKDSGDQWDNDTTPVGYYPPSGYGLYDMAGNVWEWVNDWYNETYYQDCVDQGIVDDPPGPAPASGSDHVLRGASFFGGTVYMPVAFRGHNYQEHPGFGVRCAR